ncbi:MAG: hypothetical protein HYS86_00405 [Candidatus Chisholmbacteria bacterium]|nr:hypothetical protein [Candidatus Chisholmbacteria bacterium]
MKSSSSPSLPFFSWKNLLLVGTLTLVWLKLFDSVSRHIASKWAEFFSYSEGYRLPASRIEFIPFTLDTLRQDRAETIIIFPGDSTSGGLLYHHSQAIPAYLNTALKPSGRETHTYNLALSGAHLSEQYLLTKETIAFADVVIFPIHYSFFSGRGENGAFYFRPDIVDFITQANQNDLALLQLSPRPLLASLTGELLGKLWYTYKVHRLLPHLVVGKPTKVYIRDWIMSRLDSPPATPTAMTIDPTISFSQQTPKVQEEILNQNKLLWQSIDRIDSGNINLQYLHKIGQLSQKTPVRFLAYIVPLDFPTLEKNTIINREVYDQIIAASLEVLSLYDIPVVDFNVGNPARLTPDDFYNPDHLLPAGNQKVAAVLAKIISQP